MSPTGANTEVDLFARLAVLEAICLQGGFGSAAFAMFQGPQQENVVVLSGSTDVLPVKSGTIMLTTAGVDATTLAAPVAGSAANGGDDGKVLTVVSTAAQAHTITTPTNAINGNKHIATFAAAIANSIVLQAYNGIWYMIAQIGITLT